MIIEKTRHAFVRGDTTGEHHIIGTSLYYIRSKDSIIRIEFPRTTWNNRELSIKVRNLSDISQIKNTSENSEGNLNLELRLCDY